MRHGDYKLRCFDFATRLVGLLRLMPHSKEQYVCPEPLTRLMTGDERTKAKKLFLDCRKEFEANPDAAADLKAYQGNDNKHNYTVLKGLVPQSLVGKPLTDGGIPYERSDTFFTDFDLHNPESSILSASEKSFIISIRSSHDVRLYSRDFDPENHDRSATAGMAYMHLVVIPRRKLYNIVALESTDIVEEMISHFKQFWNTHGSFSKTIERINSVARIRVQEIRDGFKKNPETKGERERMLEDVRGKVEISSNAFAAKVKGLSADDFFFGFHPAPHASVGHLHMHVLPIPCEFRQYSTGVHDWKTIPACVVMEVIREEKGSEVKM